MSPSFPSTPPLPSPPSPEASPTLRYLGGINLNDRVNTFFDNHDIASTRVVNIDQTENRDGLGVVTKVDRKVREIVISMQFKETAGSRWLDFQEAVENIEGGPYILGDGTKFASVYVNDCSGQAGYLLDTTVSPPLRMYKVSIKCTSLTAHRVAV